MDKDFFKDLLNTQVSITYKDAKKVSFAKGTISKLDPDYLVVLNESCAVAVYYEYIVTCRTINGDEGKA